MTAAAPGDPAVLAQYYATITVRMTRQSAKVFEQAAEALAGGENIVENWARTANQLATIFLLGGMELVGTTLGGTGFQLVANMTPTDWHNVPDQTRQYRVNVTKPLTRFKSDAIAAGRVSIEALTAAGVQPCPGGLLPPGATGFRLTVHRVGIHSGCYVGEVTLTDVSAGATAAAASTVAVEIEL